MCGTTEAHLNTEENVNHICIVYNDLVLTGPALNRIQGDGRRSDPDWFGVLSLCSRGWNRK